MSDVVMCARCGVTVPTEWAFVEEGDEWECPRCWHRCEEKELRDEIERLRQRFAELEREKAALRKDAERYRDDAREYHRVMGWLRATKMQHGLCQPRERRACTHCNAVDNLEDAITAYRGPPIILAATMEQSP